MLAKSERLLLNIQSHSMIQAPVRYRPTCILRQRWPNIINLCFLPGTVIGVDPNIVRKCFPALARDIIRNVGEARMLMPWTLLESRNLPSTHLFAYAMEVLLEHLQDSRLMGGKSDTFLNALEDCWEHPLASVCCLAQRPLTLLSTLSMILDTECFGCGEDAFDQFTTFVLKHSEQLFRDHAHWELTLRALNRMAGNSRRLDMSKVLSTAIRHIPIDLRLLPSACRNILSPRNRTILQRLIHLSYSRSEIDLRQILQRPRLRPSDRSISSPANFRPSGDRIQGDDLEPIELLQIQRDNPGAITISTEASEPYPYSRGNTPPPRLLPPLYSPAPISHESGLDRFPPHALPLTA